MGFIKILDENVSNIIAAGEVVENPASLIKELFENSIDANAKNIEIIIENFCDYIKITDDGIGMQKDDLYLSIERHATSKISKKEDIFNLTTFGFRGEALASIASVCKLELSSKTENDKLGHKITAFGGNIIKSADTAMKTGTIIEIRDLFYNTPARKKFLRKQSTEISNIKDIISKLALSNYNTSVTLKIDNKIVIKTSGKDIDTCIFEIFGKNIYKNLKKFKYGYIGSPEIYKATKNYIFCFVNNRYCKSNIIERAVIDGHYMKLMKNKYPFSIIFYNINPSEVDVNVHPSKKLVKFSDDKIIYKQIKSAIEDFFYEDDRKTWSFEKDNSDNSKVEYKPNSIINEKNSNLSEPQFKDQYIQSIFEINYEKENSFNVIGQIFDTYVMVKNEDSLDFYDQHAMHERIKYESLKEKYYNQTLMQKQLIIPEMIEFTLVEKDVLINNMDIFNEFKFDLDPISETEFVLRAVPDFELRNSNKNILKAMIESLAANNTVTDIRENILISMACRSSIMAGQKLDIAQMNSLVKKLHEINKFNCPHGRPVITKITKDFLDKQSKRKV